MRTIGYDIKTVQFGYPIGMPLTRVLQGTGGLEEANRSGFNPTITLVYNSVQKYAKKRTFKLPKPDIPDILNQAISDLFKSAKAGLFLASTLVVKEQSV